MQPRILRCFSFFQWKFFLCRNLTYTMNGSTACASYWLIAFRHGGGWCEWRRDASYVARCVFATPLSLCHSAPLKIQKPLPRNASPKPLDGCDVDNDGCCAGTWLCLQSSWSPSHRQRIIIARGGCQAWSILLTTPDCIPFRSSITLGHIPLDIHAT